MKNEKDYGEMLEKALNAMLNVCVFMSAVLFVAWSAVAIYRAYVVS